MKVIVDGVTVVFCLETIFDSGMLDLMRRLCSDASSVEMLAEVGLGQVTKKVEGLCVLTLRGGLSAECIIWSVKENGGDWVGFYS